MQKKRVIFSPTLRRLIQYQHAFHCFVYLDNMSLLQGLIMTIEGKPYQIVNADPTFIQCRTPHYCCNFVTYFFAEKKNRRELCPIIQKHWE